MRRRARRSAAAVACAVAFLPATPTTAAPTDEHIYKGRIVGASGSRISFTVAPNDLADVPGFRPRAVVDLRVSHAPCAIGNGETGADDFGDTDLKNRAFSAYYDHSGGRGGSSYLVEGELRKRGRARGILDFHEGFDNVTTCDTHELRWRAHEIG